MTIQLPILFEHGDHTINVEEVAAVTEFAKTYANWREAEQAVARGDFATVTVTLRSGRELAAKDTSRDAVLAAMQEAVKVAVEAALEAAE